MLLRTWNRSFAALLYPVPKHTAHLRKQRSKRRLHGQITLLIRIQAQIIKLFQQLTKTKLPIKQIASQVGYLDPSIFVRNFKAVTSMTPGQYRSNMGQTVPAEP